MKLSSGNMTKFANILIYIFHKKYITLYELNVNESIDETEFKIYLSMFTLAVAIENSLPN